MEEMIREGVGIVMISSKLPEIFGMSDWVMESGVTSLMPLECAANMDIETVASQFPELAIMGDRQICRGRQR